MNEVLALAVDAHGGMRRWEQVSRFRTEVSITGTLWADKGKPGALADVVLEGETRDQRLKITPLPWPGRYATWEPYRQTIQTDDGMVVTERREPLPPSFDGRSRQSPWDDLQVASVAGEATWNYFVAPFLLARPDFTVEETEPWSEDGEVWRRILVTYPEAVLAHSRRQIYCFDDAGLLRRLDYTLDILGGVPAVHYPSEYREFDGLLVPTRRRVHVRDPDGSPQRQAVWLAIDVSDVRFT